MIFIINPKMNDLPDEIWSEIILYLPIDDLLNFNITCLYFHKIVKEYKIIDDKYAHEIKLTSTNQLINYNFKSYYVYYCTPVHSLINKITKLNIHYFQHYDELKIKSLTNLCHLIITEEKSSEKNIIRDNHIKNLINLTHLSLNNCDGITNESIDRLTNLVSLDISNCRQIIDRITLTNLRELSFGCLYDDDQIQHSVIESLTNLQKLFISHSSILTSEFTLRLVNLQFLRLDGCHNIKSIAHLHNLHFLKLDFCRNIESIHNLNNLRYLKVKDCYNINTLSSLEKLNRLVIDDCSNIKDDSVIQLTNLTYLFIRDDDSSKITDNSIINLINLRELFLMSAKQITNKSINHLIHLSNLQVKDCEFITRDINLSTLKIFNFIKPYVYVIDPETDLDQLYE